MSNIVVGNGDKEEGGEVDEEDKEDKDDSATDGTDNVEDQCSSFFKLDRPELAILLYHCSSF